jgi:hypothetical protein
VAARAETLAATSRTGGNLWPHEPKPWQPPAAWAETLAAARAETLAVTRGENPAAARAETLLGFPFVRAERAQTETHTIESTMLPQATIAPNQEEQSHEA